MGKTTECGLRHLLTKALIYLSVFIQKYSLIKVPSKGWARCFMNFINDYFKKVWVYFMREKSKVFSNFKDWKDKVKKRIMKKLKCLKSNNNAEFIYDKFMNFCKAREITRYFTIWKTPYKNGVMKNINKTLLERARCLRLQLGQPK